MVLHRGVCRRRRRRRSRRVRDGYMPTWDGLVCEAGIWRCAVLEVVDYR